MMTSMESLPASATFGTWQTELDSPFRLNAAQIDFYAEHGYIKLKHVLSPALLEHYRAIIHERVEELSRDAVPLEQRDTYGKAFLQATPTDMGPLIFSEKSHRLKAGRDLEISDESEVTLKQALEAFSVENSAYDLGDVSFHAGWTFHRAGANTTDKPREVITVIYMDEHMRLTDPRNKYHLADMDRWMPGLKSGDVLNSHLNPVVYSSTPDVVTNPGGA